MSSRRMLIPALAGILALCWAASARAGSDAALSSRELSVGQGTAAAHFDLLGLHWLGAGTVRFRTRTDAGRWTGWRTVDPADGGPTGRWHFSEPYWTGPSDRVEWRTVGEVSRVRAFYVRSRVVTVPARRVATAGSPRIVMRPAWQANEEIRRGPPRYAPSVRFAVVHHTAGTSEYTAAESAAIVKGIELYHVRGNGWNDIGYNFLVDRYGQVFEGRYGGVMKNVIGAHAGGFNTGSTGVAVLGSYGTKRISTAARASLVQLLAWRLDLAHADPLSMVTWPSGGNGQFPPGTPVTLRAVSGHRDTGFTDCPGDALYSQLPGIAQSVAALGLPKLYDPVVGGTLGDLVRFSGRLSSPQAWSVTVRNAAGTPVAGGSGNGTAISWIWNSAAARDLSYTWTMQAGPSVRPATGTIGIESTAVPPQPLPPVLAEFKAGPLTISPDGDGVADALTVTYRLRRSASVTAQVLDGSGLLLGALFSEQRQSARVQSWPWSADSVPDGRYTLVVNARGGDGKLVTAKAAVLVDRTLGFVSAQPAVFSPNGDGSLDTISFSFDLGAPATVAVNVVQYGRVVATVFTGALEPGPQRFTWNGQGPAGVVPDGQYDLSVTATDALATVTQASRFTVDSAAAAR